MGNCHIQTELEKATLENTKKHLTYISYQAKCIDVHDGDTITVAIDFGTRKHPRIEYLSCRLEGIDCPEISRTENLLEIEHGLRAKEYVEKLIKNKIICIQINDGKEKFGRLKAVIYETDELPINLKLTSLNQKIIQEGYGIEYHGEKKIPYSESMLKYVNRKIIDECKRKLKQD